MNNLERRLVELNKVLLGITRGKKIPEDVLQRAHDVCAGAWSADVYIQTGDDADVDVVIVNDLHVQDRDCSDACEEGSGDEDSGSGQPEEPGDGTGDGDCANTCPTSCFDTATVLVSADYDITLDDCYIGVNADDPVTLTLPADAADGRLYIIKLEMDPPIGSRKVTVTTSNGVFIDDDFKFVMTTPYASAHVIKRGEDWHIISYYQ